MWMLLLLLLVQCGCSGNGTRAAGVLTGIAGRTGRR